MNNTMSHWRFLNLFQLSFFDVKKLNVLLFLWLLFVGFNGSAQLYVDWATTIGDGQKDIDYVASGISPKNGDVIFVGNYGKFQDFDQSFSEGKINFVESYSNAYYITCYDKLGRFKWVKGIPLSSNSRLNLNKLNFDENGNIYLSGYPGKPINYNTDGGEEIGEAGFSEFVTVKYNDTGKFLNFINFGDGISNETIKIKNNRIWISGYVLDSIWFDVKNIDELVTKKNNGFIAKYDLDFNYLNHRIIDDPNNSKVHGFDVEGDVLILNHQSGNDYHLVFGDSSLNLGMDSIRIQDNSFMIKVYEKGYALNGVIYGNPGGAFLQAIVLNWQGDTLLNWLDDASSKVSFKNIHWDEENGIVYLDGQSINGKFYDKNSKSYITIHKNGSGVFKVDLLSQQIDYINNFNSNNSYTQIHLGWRNELYYSGWYNGVHNLDVDKGFKEETVLGNKKNLVMAKFTENCFPIKITSIPDTIKYCGFTYGAEISLKATGTGLRYAWFENSTELQDAIYQVPGFNYIYTGTKTPYLKTTYAVNKRNGFDTLLINCKVTSVCDSDGDSIIYPRVIMGTPEYLPNLRNFDLIEGETLKIGVDSNYKPDYPVNYQWYANGLAMFDNAVIKGTQSDTLSFDHTRVYHSGIYNLGITPQECPDLEFITWDYTVSFQPTSLKNLEAESIELFPNPIIDKLQIRNSNNIYIHNVELLDMQGMQIIKVGINTMESAVLDLSRIRTGLYFIRINTDKGVLIKKFNKI